MIVRMYRRPKPKDPVLEMVTCNGCVTPKLCKQNGKCDVEEVLIKETETIIKKIHPEEKIRKKK